MRFASRSALLVSLVLLAGCPSEAPPPPPAGPAARTIATADFWNAATIYFLLTDRFENGNPANDTALGRKHDGAVLRSFEGGDLAGLLRRIEAGWFDSLGVTAIWFTPFVEQVRGSVDEGTGKTWGYHGYWTRDWTAVDPALGTVDDLRAVVEAAHQRRIRVLMDAVVNHTGPVTALDPAWPGDWVRANPNCTYKDYATTVTCKLVASLPDILTERNDSVGLPPALVEKWTREGRLDRERAELDEFFRRTGYPRAPRYYVIKWLTDWVRELGLDGYRVDTAKHFEETVSAELRKEADIAFADWKQANPEKVLDQLPFYMVGEVYGWEESQGRGYNFGDRTVDFFASGYDALINFGFKREARGSLDSLFTKYAADLQNGPLAGVSLVNYVTNHDDGQPYDLDRRDPFGAGTKLLLAPGTAQVYYGDETARPLKVSGTEGDANLRSIMNWGDIPRGDPTTAVLEHWRKLAQFRKVHPSIGAGTHRRLQESPYIFSREIDDSLRGLQDRVIVALDQPAGEKSVSVSGVFADGAELVDGYSNVRATVRDGRVTIATPYTILLLASVR